MDETKGVSRRDLLKRAGLAGAPLTIPVTPALPEQALVYQNSKPFVLIERGGNYELQPVDTGRKMEGWIEIRNPDALMQMSIVTRGASRLFAEMGR